MDKNQDVKIENNTLVDMDIYESYEELNQILNRKEQELDTLKAEHQKIIKVWADKYGELDKEHQELVGLVREFLEVYDTNCDGLSRVECQAYYREFDIKIDKLKQKVGG